MVTLNDDLFRGALFPLVDALGLPMTYEPKTRVLSGRGEHEVRFEGLGVTFKQKLVDAWQTEEELMLMTRMTGNLMILAGALSTGVGGEALVLLDAAKVTPSEGWLQKHKPDNLTAAIDKLGQAVVKTFSWSSGGKWIEDSF